MPKKVPHKMLGALRSLLITRVKSPASTELDRKVTRTVTDNQKSNKDFILSRALLRYLLSIHLFLVHLLLNCE